MTATQAPDIEAMLQRACNISESGRKGTRKYVSTTEFAHIAHLISILDGKLGRTPRQMWSTRPRLYILLRSIGALSYMDAFVDNNIFDISLPFSAQTLPDFIEDPTSRSLFLENQTCVLTDARILESSTREHLHLNGSAEDHLQSLRELGSGGFGAVDVIVSRLSLRLYARKRVFRGRDSEATRREQQYLVEEIRVLKLLSHRHLTKIIQSYSDHQYIGYLMEPIADGNLHQYLVRKRIPDTDLVHLRYFFGCLAGAVHYLHSKNIRHRDLKLENVLVKNSRVYVADFGTAMEWSIVRRGTTQDRGVPVTHWYMAPEVDERLPRNQASDMWSLGIVFLEMLTVIKGHTVSRWKDYLRKNALKARQEPYPCRNVKFIHEWMLVLQMCSRRHEAYDDENMVLKDNEPLSWIRALLEHKQGDRISAKALVTTIADSMHFTDFACFDCVHDFRNPQYRHSGVDHWGSSDEGPDRDAIDAEVTAMLSAANPVEPQVNEEKERTVTAWLEQSQQHWADSHSRYVADASFAMPGSFYDGGIKPEFPTEMVEYGGQENSFETSVNAADGDPGEATLKPPSATADVRHEGGFIIDQDEDSSGDDGSTAGSPVISNGLFPVIQDASSESSDDAISMSPIDSPMIDLEDEDRLSAILEESSEHVEGPAASQRSRKGSVVRFDRNIKVTTLPPAYVEEDVSEQTVELSRRERALTLNKPVLEENTIIPAQQSAAQANDPSSKTLATRSFPSRREEVGSTTLSDFRSVPSPTGSLEEALLDEAIIGKLSAKPPKRPTKNKTKRPPVKPRETILLPWHDTQEPANGQLTAPSANYHKSTLPQIAHHDNVESGGRLPALGNGEEQREVEAAVQLLPASADQNADKPVPRPQTSGGHAHAGSSLSGGESQSSKTHPARSKLSTANVDKLNKANKERPKSGRREFEDDGFTPASFIEKSWQSAEAADSLATSAMSDATAKKLRGIGLVWNDKAYRYLECYCKSGNAGAVRRLLDQGCNCGTILKPRPGPLFNAIQGGSARHNKCVRALIKAGCNVNVERRGKTALHAAVEQPYFYGYQKLLAMLLAAGANMNKPDLTDEYPLTKLFKGVGDAPLEEYQRQSLALMLHANVQSMVDVDVRQAFTMETALHLAVRRRSAQAVALLIHRQADVNAKSSSGTTPLLIAANQWKGRLSDQQERILAFLLAAENLEVDVVGGTLRRSALHYAAAAGSATALDRLLEKGADPNLKDKEGNNALRILKNAQSSGAENEDFQVMLDLLSE